MVVLGGVPGAGKSTVLRAVRDLRPGVGVLDPEQQQRRLAPHVRGVPYRVWRPLVHVLHHLAVLRALLAGPRDGRPLVVHDTATRAWGRAVACRLAAARGRRPVLLLLDVTEGSALAGQVERGRVVRRPAFERHWRRWTLLRSRLTGDAVGDGGRDGWARVALVTRADAVGELLSLLDRDPGASRP
jgi:predicted kinase